MANLQDAHLQAFCVLSAIAWKATMFAVHQAFSMKLSCVLVPVLLSYVKEAMASPCSQVWEVQDAGLQAAQRVLSAADPLAMLTDVSQSFPALVSSLARQAVDADVKVAATKNERALGVVTSGYLLLNGLPIDIANFDYFSAHHCIATDVNRAG